MRFASWSRVASSAFRVPIGAALAASMVACWSPFASASSQKEGPLGEVLKRAADYVAAYQTSLSNVIAEERYAQVLTGASAWAGPRSREMTSDFALIQDSGGKGWIAVRDVFEVGGAPVKDHPRRLGQLLADKGGDGVKAALQLARESAKYNIGDMRRTVNDPTMVLLFLYPSNQSRFSFKSGGMKDVNGRQVQLVEYQETGRPTFIRSGYGGDLPVRGRIWLEPDTGRVIKTQLILRADEVNPDLAGMPRQGAEPPRMDISVTYRPNEDIGVLTPVEMREIYVRGFETVSCTATYAKYRRLGPGAGVR